MTSREGRRGCSHNPWCVASIPEIISTFSRHSSEDNLVLALSIAGWRNLLAKKFRSNPMLAIFPAACPAFCVVSAFAIVRQREGLGFKMTARQYSKVGFQENFPEISPSRILPRQTTSAL